MEKTLYVIAGCNGAGKTTASFTILPEILNCKEFVNADEIARGLSPFQPETVAFEAGRIMLNRINELLKEGKTFAIETTLATKSYKSKILEAQQSGYKVTLLFFWLENVDMAITRVATRVSEGGHNIPEDVIRRRYMGGIKNLFSIYIDIVDEVIVVDNSRDYSVAVAEKIKNHKLTILDNKRFDKIKRLHGRE
ncbi:zeta toxin family protein [Flavobacterium psychrotrophum]|uniref:zeta toxin family protein n=1 Tax=Flavobacterium psychrotrophum TaxID=2294119 RepID=UPI000E319DAA|nr:zeta toxin family protein [Flavobacterium psychrotrophum]